MAEPEGPMLHIPDSLGRDIDAGRAAGRDLADFLPDSMNEQLYEQSAARKEPVHAENLIPITHQQGAAMRAIDPESGSLPRFPATRRVIPAPFKRDRVSGGSHGKAWRLVTGEKILKGDIITDLGLVVDVQEQVLYENLDMFAAGEDLVRMTDWKPGDKVATGKQYEVTGAGGKVITYRAEVEVKVFR